MLHSKTPIDTTRLLADIRLLIADCIHLKSLLRSRWTRPMRDEQQRHHLVRRRLTERFVLLAFSRGRLHVRRPPRDLPPGTSWDATAHHATIAARLLPDYAAPAHEGATP